MADVFRMPNVTINRCLTMNIMCEVVSLLVWFSVSCKYIVTFIIGNMLM